MYRDNISLPKETVIDIIGSCTLLNHLTKHQHEDYIRHTIEVVYKDTNWTENEVKKFLIYEYPLISIGNVLNKEQLIEYRKIQPKLNPNSKSEMNAQVIKSINRKYIYFSEWLYTFLWDYHHMETKYTWPGISGKNLEEAKIKMTTARYEMAETLRKGKYRNLELKEFIGLKGMAKEGTIFKMYHLLSLIFIHAHELAHVYLGHLNDKNLKKLSDSDKRIPTGEDAIFKYKPTQIEEFDADLYASDIYYKFVYAWLENHEDKRLFLEAHVMGLEFLRLESMAQEKEDLNFEKYHPPAKLRLIYICLRHKDKLLKNGFDKHLMKTFSNLVNTDGLDNLYDYKKSFEN